MQQTRATLIRRINNTIPRVNHNTRLEILKHISMVVDDSKIHETPDNVNVRYEYIPDDALAEIIKIIDQYLYVDHG